MKKAMLILLVLPQLSFAAPTGTSAETKKSKTEVSETGKKSAPSKKDPSATPCIPQQTHADRVQDLAKLDSADPHSTNCPGDGAIKTQPGGKVPAATVPVANPVDVK